MHATRRRICCNATNAFRATSALRAVFLDAKLIRHSSSSQLPLEIETSQPQESPSNDPLDAKSYLDPYSLGNTLQNLRSQNRAIPVERFARDHQQSLAEALSSSSVVKNTLPHVPTKRNQKTFVEGEDFRRPPGVEGSAEIHMVEAYEDKASRIAEKKRTSEDVEVLEYEGRYVQPVKATQSGAHTKLPWLQYMPSEPPFEHGHDFLDAEIKAFGTWSRPSEAEVAAREAVIEETSRLVRQLCPNYKVEAFGSARNGLALANSDVDLRIFYDPPASDGDGKTSAAPPAWEARKNNMRQLYKLRSFFDHDHGYMMCRIRYARYPLIHMTHKDSGIDVQIVCSNNTSKQRSRIASYLNEHPYYFDLYAILKTTLDMRGLNDVFRGGLGSYSLFMLIRYLAEKNRFWRRSRGNNAQGRSKPVQDLVSFLQFYGKHFDTYTDMITVEPFAKLPKRSYGNYMQFVASSETHKQSQICIIDQSQPYLLCIQDPEDPLNDLGRQAYGWKHIKETFSHLHTLLNRNWDNFKESPDSRSPSMLYPLVQRCGNAYDGRRGMAVEYGTRVLKNPALVEEKTTDIRFSRPVDTSGKRGRHSSTARSDAGASEEDAVRPGDLHVKRVRTAAMWKGNTSRGSRLRGT